MHVTVLATIRVSARDDDGLKELLLLFTRASLAWVVTQPLSREPSHGALPLGFEQAQPDAVAAHTATRHIFMTVGSQCPGINTNCGAERQHSTPPVICIVLLHEAIQLQQRVIAATAIVDEHLLAPGPILRGHHPEGGGPQVRVELTLTLLTHREHKVVQWAMQQQHCVHLGCHAQQMWGWLDSCTSFDWAVPPARPVSGLIKCPGA